MSEAIAQQKSEQFPKIYNSEKAKLNLLPPKESASRMRVPDGFQVSLFAAEPDVQQPIAFTIDHRGRLWIAENYTYSESKLNFDTTLNDRVIILEDTDNDGKYDKRKVFWDQAKKLTSIEVGLGGVWLTCAPELLFIPDEDGDDIPDGPPQVILDGWNDGAVRHNIVNGLMWGPDGWLYGRHGIMASSFVGKPGATASQRTQINCGIWRYHPLHKKFDVVAHGMTNPWGMDYTQLGEIFVSNTVIGHMWHVVPGARFRRMYGAHFEPHTYDVIEQSADHFHWDTGEKWHDIKKIGLSKTTDAAGGGHAHCGLMIYNGQNWPKEYHGHLFTCNLHGLRINRESLKQMSSGRLVAKHEKDFAKTDDIWFRGIELKYGPDGGVYVLDWADVGECHENDGVHRTSGRIYKITYKDLSKDFRQSDTSSLSSEDLFQLVNSDSEFKFRHARNILQDRHRKKLLSADERKKLRKFAMKQSSKPTVTQVRTLWMLNVIDEFDLEVAEKFLSSESDSTRAWCVRLVADYIMKDEANLESAWRLIYRVALDPGGPLTELYSASASNRIPKKQRLSVIKALCRSTVTNPVVSKLLWYAIEPHVTTQHKSALEIAKSSNPSIRHNILRRLASEIESKEENGHTIIKILESMPTQTEKLEAMKAFEKGLAGLAKVDAPKGWEEFYQQVKNGSPKVVVTQAEKLATRFGDGQAIAQLMQVAQNGNNDAATRATAIASVANTKPKNLFEFLNAMRGDRSVHMPIIKALKHCDSDKVPDLIVGQLRTFPADVRAESIDVLVGNPNWAGRLLKEVENGRFDRSEISAWHARVIESYKNEALSKGLEKAWGKVGTSSAEKQAQIKLLMTQLTESHIEKADASKGRALFQKNCATCHALFGKGETIGPDLTGANRKNLNYLLENIVDPSASVAVDFRLSRFELVSGIVETGVVLSKTNRGYQIQTPKERKLILQSDIEVVEKLDTSLMPDGILQNLSIAETTDLIKYLQSDSQVSLPQN